MSRIILIFLIVMFCLWPVRSFSYVYQAGFRTLGLWLEEPRLRLDVNIWYPSLRPESALNYLPWTIRGSINAKPVEGKFPLLIISHATPATRFSYHYLAAWFARNGFFVVAPTHSCDSLDNMDSIFSWSQLESRAKEIAEVLDIILKDKELSQFINTEQIGFIGFGAGGSAGLLLGGAIPNCNGWLSYCDLAGSDDAYCSAWAKNKINIICENLPHNGDLTDRRIKAFAIIAPAYGMLFDKESFKYFYSPILLVSAGRDKFNRSPLHCEAIARILGNKATYLDLPTADAGALIANCPPAMAADLPELCLSLPEEDKTGLHNQLETNLLAFFTRYLLKNDQHHEQRK